MCRAVLIGETSILAHFEEQAGWNDQLGSPFTAALCRQMAKDFKARGPVFDLCKDWSGNPRKDALALRIAGALHHAVLTGSDDVLASAYPEKRPNWSMDEVWPRAVHWLAANLDHVRLFIQSPPQTNETRRSIALLPGFLRLAAHYDMPMDLLELGASAGLNQNWDRFNYQTDEWSREGASDVTIATEWDGEPPQYLSARPEIRSRAACDIRPLDVSDPAEALKLKCYTWADQFERLTRLDAAIKLAVETGIHVDPANAADWLEQKIANRPSDGLTVIYHSVYLIYPPRDEIARTMEIIRSAGEQATASNPLAWLCYESEALFGGDRTSPNMQTRLQSWPGGEVSLLNTSDGHVTKLTSHE